MGEMELVSGENLKGTLDMQIPSAFYGDGKVPEDAPKAIISIINTDGSVYKNVNNVITTGKLGSLVQAENVASGQLTASKVIGQLDILVTSIANTFNELQTREGAYCLSSDWTKLEPSLTELFTGGTVITNEDGTTTTVYTAAGIQVNPEIETNPNLVATAYFPTPADVDELAVGNSENVIAMLATRTNKNNEGLSGMTFEEFYTSLVGKIGVQSRTGEETAAAQSDVVNSINNQVLSETSVDLNEELTDLVKFQTAFTAAARVFNTCNNCLDILVNLGG